MGKTITHSRDKSGSNRHSRVMFHTPDDDEKYRRAHHAAASSESSTGKQGGIVNQYKQELGHGGPIM